MIVKQILLEEGYNSYIYLQLDYLQNDYQYFIYSRDYITGFYYSFTDIFDYNREEVYITGDNYKYIGQYITYFYFTSEQFCDQ